MRKSGPSDSIKVDIDGLRQGASDCPDYSTLMPANFTTLADFSVSSVMNLANAAGALGTAFAPNSSRRAFTFGSARAALISLLSLSTIWAECLSALRRRTAVAAEPISN